MALCESGGFHLINPAVGNVLTSLILDLKCVIVDAIYSSCENLAIVALENGDLLKVDTRTNPCRIIQTNRNFPSIVYFKQLKDVAFFKTYFRNNLQTFAL